ncbi:MAG: WecB/TagA/CpsF family glycosyltransferase [Pseudomonadota bacterium]
MLEIITRKPSNHALNSKITTFVNPYSYFILRKKPDIYSQFDHIYLDGFLLVTLLRLFGFRNIERKSFDMTSMAPEVFNECASKNKTIFFVGSHADEIEKASLNIKKKFPDLYVLGCHHGYFDTANPIKTLLEDLAKVNPETVIVGMGTPLQELFLLELRHHGWNGTGYTCGGFFHQTAKHIQYYPNWANKLNLRWLFRIIDEPKLIRRYAITYPAGVLLFAIDMLRMKLPKPHNASTGGDNRL